MTRYDVFNGDADGLCALQQLRLEQPREATPVTGAKRDIRLLDRIDAAAGDELTVLDVSLHANRAALDRLLAGGVRVVWFDHHHPGEVPVHPGLAPHIDTDPAMCTSLIVNRHLAGRHARWAAVGAFGDNLGGPARALCASLGLPDAQVATLQALGEALNYNAYGDDEQDLMVHPARLSRMMRPFEDPHAFAAGSPVFERLVAVQREDLAHAMAQPPTLAAPGLAVYRLGAEPWARRVRGAFGNHLAQADPGRAHAIVTLRADGCATVSLRVPAGAPVPADRFCRRWPSGNGRAIAAGVDRLGAADTDALVHDLVATYGAGAGPA
jgi:hypothetical protein